MNNQPNKAEQDRLRLKYEWELKRYRQGLMTLEEITRDYQRKEQSKNETT